MGSSKINEGPIPGFVFDLLGDAEPWVLEDGVLDAAVLPFGGWDVLVAPRSAGWGLRDAVAVTELVVSRRPRRWWEFWR